MQSPSLILLSSQQALQRSMDIVANNVANSSTTSYKREGVEFSTFLSKGDTPDQNTDFVVDHSTYRDMSAGPIETTSSPLDLAIQGAGYFSVKTPAGKTEYTRNGSFQLDAQGQIVDHNGDVVLTDAGQPIVIPDTTTQINISGDGFVTARTDNGVNLFELGKIGVFNFKDEQELEPQGAGLYTTKQLATRSQEGSIVQGALEQSNVKAVSEMTDMIRIQRAYEQTANLISQEGQLRDDAIQKLSKTTI